MSPINVESAHSPDRNTPNQSNLPSSRGPTSNDAKNQPRAPESSEQSTNHPISNTVETVKKSSRSEDRPMGEDQPQAPFALVGLSYYAALAIVGLILGAIYFFYF